MCALVAAPNSRISLSTMICGGVAARLAKAAAIDLRAGIIAIVNNADFTVVIDTTIAARVS